MLENPKTHSPILHLKSKSYNIVQLKNDDILETRVFTVDQLILRTTQ